MDSYRRIQSTFLKLIWILKVKNYQKQMNFYLIMLYHMYKDLKNTKLISIYLQINGFLKLKENWLNY